MNSVYKAVVCVFCLATLAMVVITFAADDPFTGTWREIPSRTDSGGQSNLILTPNGDGITIEGGNGQKGIIRYGKDYLSSDGTTWNIIRVDDHTLKSTFALNGKIIVNETATASPDGKRYTRAQQRVGSTETTTMEFERVGPVPTGDAFFGTWKPAVGAGEAGPLTYTLKVDRETCEISRYGKHWVTAKFDGKDYKLEDGSNSTVQLKRVDNHTFEMVQKFDSISLQTVIWQVQGNTLTRTVSRPRAQQPTVREFERIK